MKDPRDTYKATTLRILGSFQLLEYALKLYISCAYQVIAKATAGKLHFGYSYSDVESAPLERLLNIFSKLCSNAELVKRLNKLREDRNHIAHESLLIAIGQSYDLGAIKESEEAFFYMEDELIDCLVLTIQELRKVKESLNGSVA